LTADEDSLAASRDAVTQSGHDSIKRDAPCGASSLDAIIRIKLRYLLVFGEETNTEY